MTFYHLFYLPRKDYLHAKFRGAFCLSGRKLWLETEKLAIKRIFFSYFLQFEVLNSKFLTAIE